MKPRTPRDLLIALTAAMVVVGAAAAAARPREVKGERGKESTTDSPAVRRGDACVGLRCRPQAVNQGATQSTGSPPVLIAHPDNIQPGLAAARPQAALANPREHDPRAVTEGKVLFVSYNCADCHGDEGSGNVGPSLQDGRWHFGGTIGDIYESIEEGRPDGMPAWGGRISESEIWALVAYVRTLSAGKDVSTENFEGATVQRGGH